MASPQTGRLTLKLLESNKAIQDNMYMALAEELNKYIEKNKTRVLGHFQTAIRGWLLSSPEMISLSSSNPGDLGAQFGLREGAATAIINTIVDEVTNNFKIDIKKISKRLKGGVDFHFQKGDLTNLLTLTGGHVMTEKGQNLHWLDWLLTKGDTVIVTGYEYEPSFAGRSGGGIMSLGSVWRVPPQYSGTQDKNFITKIFDGQEKQISKILQGLFA